MPPFAPRPAATEKTFTCMPLAHRTQLMTGKRLALIASRRARHDTKCRTNLVACNV